MTPEERQLLTGLFDRIRSSANVPRESEAEAFISDAVRTQPYAPYLLTQTVIVQDQALRAANERLQQLEGRVQELESARPAEPPPSFLGNLGKSLFGAPSAPSQPGAGPEPRPSAPPSGPWGQTAPQQPAYAQPMQQPAYAQPMQQPGYAPQQSAWGAPPPQAPAGGGFLHGALGAAAGVAGGVLLADSIRGLFSHQGSPFGIGSGFGGMGAGLGGGLGAGGLGLGGLGASGGGETVVNNYYGDSSGQNSNDVQNASDSSQDDNAGVQDAGYDDSSDWAGGDSGGDDSNYDV